MNEILHKKFKLDFYSSVRNFINLTDDERKSILKAIETSQYNLSKIFSPEIEATNFSELLKKIHDIDDSESIFQPIGWVDDWSEVQFDIGPDIVFSDCYAVDGSGLSHGVRYYQDILIGFCNEFKRLFIEECFIEKEDGNCLDKGKFEVMLSDACIMVKIIEENNFSVSALCEQAKSILNNFNYNMCKKFINFSDWIILAAGNDNLFTGAPINYSMKNEFEKFFQTSFLHFEWDNKQHMVWLSKNLIPSFV